ncbi:unnamed protein product [Urochloa humidicola]
MGKRKSRSSKLAAQPKKAPKLEKVFTCPFCNHPESVKCRIHLKYGYAEALCLICDESYCTVVPNKDDLVVAPRRAMSREAEVPAVGGAAEEEEGLAAADGAVHRPRRVQRRPVLAPGEMEPVLVGGEVVAVPAAPQPHVRPVREELHLSPAWFLLLPGDGGARGRGFLGAAAGGEKGKGSESEEFVARRLRLGAEAEAGVFQRKAVAEHGSCPPAASHLAAPSASSSCCHVGPTVLRRDRQ